MVCLKKGFSLLSLVLALLVCLPAPPARAADGVNLSVNGYHVAAGAAYQERDVTMVAAEQFARFSGVTVRQEADGVLKMTQGQTTLVLTPGSREALLNGRPVALPAAPEQTGDAPFVPLRFVSTAFGFRVDWDGTEKAVSLSRNQVQDGMTPQELLVKSAQACQAVNTYSMSGDMHVQLNITADGKPVSGIPQDIRINLTGSVQNNPLQIYMKENILPQGGSAAAPLTMEVYMNKDKMYIKPAGQADWLVSPTPVPPELLRQQQDVQTDPIKAVEQMKELGVLLSYSDGAAMNGNNYYVVNATIDQDKFRQGYWQMLQQLMPGLLVPAGQTPAAQVGQAVQKLLNKTSVDLFYTAYINKQTMLNDLTRFQERIGLDFNPREIIGGAVQPGVRMPEKVKVNVNVQGDLSVDGVGRPFVAPDVSGAKEIPQAPPAPAPLPEAVPGQ